MRSTHKPRRAGNRRNKFRPSKLADFDANIRSRVQSQSAFRAYLVHHLRVSLNSLGQLSRTPVSTLVTSAVISIALALPAGLYLLLGNVEKMADTWESTTQISLFLHDDITSAEAKKLTQKLESWKQITHVEYISPKKALKEFRAISGFGDALDILDHNPLPPVMLVQPHSQLVDPSLMQALLLELRALKQVDIAQLDMEWIQRLTALLNVGKRGIWVFAALLGVAILLIVGNTIRLTILNRRQEIVVTKLIGATNAFIRRPFLYTGFWYGLIGALMAWVLIAIQLRLLQGPVAELSSLYNSQFSISGLGLVASLLLIAVGAVLSWMGSWIAVGRHLQAIEPT